MSRTTVLFTTLAALALGSPLAAAPTPEFPLTLFGNESVAATDQAWGFTLNPAVGGIRYPSELMAAYTDLEPSGKVYSGAYANAGAGLAVVFPEHGTRAWTLGFGGGQDRFRAGFAATRLREKQDAAAGFIPALPARPDGRATDYKVGFLSRPVPWLSVGVVADHIFQTRYIDRVLGREYTVGIGLRPLALTRGKGPDQGHRLTLTADLLMAEAATRRQARARLGAEMELKRGLVIRGAIQDRGGFQLGFGLLSPRSAYHGSAAFDRDQDRRSVSHAISIHRGEEKSAFTGSKLRRVAAVRISGVLGDDALSGFTIPDGASGTRPVGPIHKQLERALEDPLTRGVLLELGGAANMAQIEELRPRITRLRAAGKPVVAYMEEGGGRGDLYLAAACDRVVASEEAYFAGLGLRAERRYYRRLLDDWGVRIDRSSHGRYKSAWRGYSEDSTPKADREAIERNLDVAQELFVSAVAADRRMDRARLLTILDGRRWGPDDLARAGLVDSVGYREDALRMLGRLTRLGDKPRTVNLARTPAVERAWTVRRPIAVVYASGAIATGSSGNDIFLGPYMGSTTIVRQLERAFHHPEVRAVVLRVESTGGSGLASNLIDHAVQRLKRETRKPLIVSMGSVAGSGGYYIAAHGDRIFADRHTRTGSIGVVTIKPSLEGWYEKHHVRQDEFDRGRYMRGLSGGRDWDREIQASADSAIVDYYRGFVAKVADGRGLGWAQVDSVAQGRVWMGEDALRHRLVDEIGGLEAAVAEARRRSGIPAGERIRLLEFRRPRPWLLERLAGSAMMAVWTRSVRVPDADAVYYLADADAVE